MAEAYQRAEERRQAKLDEFQAQRQASRQRVAAANAKLANLLAAIHGATPAAPNEVAAAAGGASVAESTQTDAGGPSPWGGGCADADASPPQESVDDAAGDGAVDKEAVHEGAIDNGAVYNGAAHENAEDDDAEGDDEVDDDDDDDEDEEDDADCFRSFDFADYLKNTGLEEGEDYPAARRAWRALGSGWGGAPYSKKAKLRWVQKYGEALELRLAIERELGRWGRLEDCIAQLSDPTPRDERGRPITVDRHLLAERRLFDSRTSGVEFERWPAWATPFALGEPLPPGDGDGPVERRVHVLLMWLEGCRPGGTYASAQATWKARGLPPADFPEELRWICASIDAHDRTGLERLTGFLERHPELRPAQVAAHPPSCNSDAGIAFGQAVDWAVRPLIAREKQQEAEQETAAMLPPDAGPLTHKATQALVRAMRAEREFYDRASGDGSFDSATAAYSKLTANNTQALRNVELAQRIERGPRRPKPEQGVADPAAPTASWSLPPSPCVAPPGVPNPHAHSTPHQRAPTPGRPMTDEEAVENLRRAGLIG